jgi:hypothetical protein
MSDGPSFERDIGPLRRLLDDALKGMQAAEVALLHHSAPDARLTAINFPLEESLLRETTRLLDGWKAAAAALLRKLDTAAAAANLQFERLFDDNAGRQSEGFLRRRVHIGHAAPETISAELADLLAISAALDGMLKEAKASLLVHHRNCEACLEQLVMRRQRVDVDLEDASRRLALLKMQTNERRMAAGHGRSLAQDPASEEERRALALDRQGQQGRERTLRSEWETLQRMIADDEDFVGVMNRTVAATNVMTQKLALDIEQRVALLKAADVQSDVPAVDTPAPALALIAAFDANIVAGHDLPARKQRADEAFARWIAASQVSPDGEADEAGGDDASEVSPLPQI